MIPNRPYDVVNGCPMSRWDTVAGSKVYLVHTENEFRSFFELLMSKKRVFCDTETEGLYAFGDQRIIGSSFGWGSTHFYVPCRHRESVLNGPQVSQLSMDYLRPFYQDFFSQENIETVWHNLKFDAKFYLLDDVHINTIKHDTRILWHLFNENAPGALKVISTGWRNELGQWVKGLIGPDASLNEKEISTWRTEESRARKKAFSARVMNMADELQCEPRFQGVKRNDLKKIIKSDYLSDHIYAKSSKDDIHYGYVPIEIMTPYAGVDTFLTSVLFDHVMENMAWNDKNRALYQNEMALSDVIMGAEVAGVKMDRAYLQKMSIDYAEKSAKLGKQIQAELVPRKEGESDEEWEARNINLSAPVQLAEALVAYGVPLTARSEKTKKLSLDKKILIRAAKEYPIVNNILELRKIDKVKSTYFDSILSKLSDDDILHANFNQNVSTGRMSSNDPNLQNQPRGNVVRNAFIALNEDYIYLLADYSQIEVRLTAHFSEDPILLDAYRNNQDVHCRTGGQMFGASYAEMLEAKESKDKENKRYNTLREYRNIGKTLNFALIYGVTAMGLSEQIPRPGYTVDWSDQRWINQCEDFMRTYFRTHIGVKRFINKYSRLVQEQGYIENPFGRVRHLPHVNAVKLTGDRSLGWLEQKAKRQGVNALVQGTAGDLFKIAVVRVAKILEGTKSYIISFVHDEIQMYLHKEDIHLINDIKRAMEGFNFKVPIEVEFEYSLTSWGNKKPIARRV